MAGPPSDDNIQGKKLKKNSEFKKIAIHSSFTFDQKVILSRTEYSKFNSSESYAKLSSPETPGHVLTDLEFRH